MVAGAIWEYRGFTITPVVKYLGRRYGDAEHDEKIPSYVVCDLSLSYEKEKFYGLKSFKVGVNIDNLFDKKYVSVINAMDDAVSGTSYGAGAPFSVKAFISFSF